MIPPLSGTENLARNPDTNRIDARPIGNQSAGEKVIQILAQMNPREQALIERQFNLANISKEMIARNSAIAVIALKIINTYMVTIGDGVAKVMIGNISATNDETFKLAA